MEALSNGSFFELVLMVSKCFECSPKTLWVSSSTIRNVLIRKTFPTNFKQDETF